MQTISSSKKLVLIILFIAVFGISIKAQIFKIEPNAKLPWKSPSLASLQSLVLPGAGYLYQDKMVLGYSVMGGEILLAGLGGYFYTKTVDTEGRLATSVDEEIDRNRAIGSAFFSVMGAVHLFQFVHSGILAHKSNKVNGYVTIQNKGLGASLAFNF